MPLICCSVSQCVALHCSISYGMVFAVAYLLAQRYYFLDDNNHSNLFSPGIALSATLASIIGMGSYTTFSFLCRNKLECNEIHSYTVFVPVSGSSRYAYQHKQIILVVQ